MQCSLVDNPVTVPSDILDSMPIHNSTFGTNITYDPSFEKFITLSIGTMRRLTIRNCLKNESNTLIKCKWDDLETQAKLLVTGN